LQYFDRIVPDDAHVLQVQVAELLQKAADARSVHLDAEIIVFRVRLRDRRSGLAHAETDLEDPGGGAAEQPVEVKGSRRERHAVDGKQLFAGTPLRVGDAPLAQDETSNRAPVFLQET